MTGLPTATLLDFASAALSSWPVPDAGQARLRSDYLAFLAEHPDGLWRDGPAAHLTASAFVLDVRREHVLLTHHRKGGFWVQPGGHLEPGDSTLAAAALREATEETGLLGLTVVGPADLHRHELSAAFGRCREHLDAAYLLLAPPGSSAGSSAGTLANSPTVSPESLDVAWWPVDALPDGVVADLPARLARLLRQAA